MPRKNTRRAQGEGNISLHKTHGYYQVKVPTGRTKPDGKPEYRYTTAPTEAEALEKKKALERQIADNTLPVGGKLTVAQYLEQFCQDNNVRWSERTQELNRSLITLHINPIIGNIQLAKLEPQHIAKMQSKIAEPKTKIMQHKNHTREVIIGGKTTAFQSRSLMIHALNAACKWRILNFNPAAVIDPVKIEREEYQILEPDEVSALLAYALEHNPWLYALMFTGFDNGMRPGELRGFGVEHRRTRNTQTVLEIRRTARPTPPSDDPKLWFGPVKTKRSRRDVILSEDNIEALEIQKTLILDHQKKNIVTFKDNGILFPSRAGTPMHGHNLGDDLETLCKKLGLPRITPHDMRHTAISLMIYACMDIQQIANIVGHASAAFTLQRYAHIFKHQQVAASRIGLKSKLGK